MSFSVILDMVAALAVTALLAESYGVVRRQFFGAAWAPVILGILFGVMTFVQMNNPLEPTGGLIIDLRNIPIALAGAFLGWRGLIPCLIIAAGVRIDIGGVGMVAGLWGMCLAGLSGMIWARKVARFERRTYSMLILLGLAMSSHLLSALALPRELAIWFFTEAAAPILLMNLLAVPLIGYLLERENVRMAREAEREAAVTRDPVTGLLTAPAFVRDMSHAYAAHSFGTYAGFLKITPAPTPVFGLLAALGPRVVPFTHGHLLNQHLEHGGMACMTAEGEILVPISDVEMSNETRVLTELRRALRDDGAMASSTTPFEMEIIEARDPAKFLEIAEKADASEHFGWAEIPPSRPLKLDRNGGAPSAVRRSRIFDPEEHDGLFAKADFLINRSQS